MEILRYTAFSTDPAGGNPAGVVLDASGAGEAQMLAIAAKVGYSETAFLVESADRRFDVRYFSPLAEVPFCGHATIASAVAYAERHGVGPLTFDTQAGQIEIQTRAAGGTVQATLTSVPTRTVTLDDLDQLLAALRWDRSDLAFGGYLRELGLVETPATITVHQGVDMGRPGLLTVDIPAGTVGISVSGSAVALPGRRINPGDPRPSGRRAAGRG